MILTRHLIRDMLECLTEESTSSRRVITHLLSHIYEGILQSLHTGLESSESRIHLLESLVYLLES